MLLTLHKPRGRGRGLGRPKSVLTVAVIVVLMYYCLLKGEEIRLSRLAANRELELGLETQIQGVPELLRHPDHIIQAQNDNIDSGAVTRIEAVPSPETNPNTTPIPTQATATDRTPPEQEDPAQQARLVQAEYEAQYENLNKAPGAGSIYGGTVNNLKEWNVRSRAQENNLRDADADADGQPYFNPYPNYNTKNWKASHATEYVPCEGPAGTVVGDIRVLKGRPQGFPDPGFGSYEVLGIDKNICFEREGRLGQYGFEEDGESIIDWAGINWGELQKQCVTKNKDRFDLTRPPNMFVSTRKDGTRNKTSASKESRTAVLLRSYTGKDYTENDKRVIRSIVTELNLRTGGEYQVFLFVHVKKPDMHNIFEDDDVYQFVIQNEVPQEFWDMTILWNDDSVKRMYPKLDEMASKVHNAQYLSVQKFMQENREFDFVWNWEMDSRVVGHHYDFVNKLAEFSKKQPRKGLWERNERFYIRDVHGDYDTKFRETVGRIYGNETVWGAPEVTGVKPLGPKPPVRAAWEDDYEWGVGEEADLITLSPIFNPVNSNWILSGQVWGFQAGKDLPRRATIITQSRLSRRLVDLMHAEDLKGNHVGSEMMPQTVSLLHGLKAVYAPMPVFFDRPWTGAQLERWFNGGPKGESGGFGSAMGWGRESRFQGSTWYFRADPPQRMYNNWMGYEDTGIGGEEWEEVNGRPCLPGMILHPVKDVRRTERGYSSKSNLPYR